MKIILESKFKVGDTVSTQFGTSYTVVDVEFKQDADGYGKIFYLLEKYNRERQWFSETTLKKGDTIKLKAENLIGTFRIKVKDFKDLLEDLPDEAYIEFTNNEFDYPLEIETVRLNADVVEIGMK